jgi:hypothetical protein
VDLRWFLTMCAAIVLVVGLTVFVNDSLDNGGGGTDQVVGTSDGALPGEGPAPSDEPQTVPGPGQVAVQGTVDTVLIADAVLQPRALPTPLTVTSERGFGNGGEVTTVLVQGEPATIEWDGGRPFMLSGGPSLVLDPVALVLTPGGLQLVLGGGAHTITAGTYELDTPVAVGQEGIATPRDRVTFDAVEGSLLEARGDASILLGPDSPRRFVGPGRVLLVGALEVTDDDGTREVADLTSDPAAFDLTFTPAADGTWTVSGIVDAPQEG